MALDIARYFQERNRQMQAVQPPDAVFLTISRETGCHSRSVALLIQHEIQHQFHRKWDIINKEDILDAANAMKLNPIQVQHLLNAEEKGHLDEILLAFGQNKYKSYQSVRNTVRGLIEQLAQEGNRIIIGRAGAIITAGMKGGVHVRLIAPLAWRVDSIGKQLQLKEKEAKQFVEANDIKRQRLFKAFCDKEISNDYFDLIFNNARFSDEEIAKTILSVLVSRYKF
ncbi:MAG: cytidylate kinase family protein [Bacteroidales bacterium]|jgi:cytidylate kinase|nr:cytidylate kinase family protein [Bacteroidales bacterium]